MSDVEQDVQERQQRVLGLMKQEGIGALLVYSNAQHNMLRAEQIFWLTDFRPLGPTVAVLKSDGSSTVVTSPAWDAPRARQDATGATVIGVDTSQLSTQVAELARVLPQPIALAGRHVMPLWFADELAELLGPDLVDAEKLIPSLLSTRTPVELDRLTRAAQIADEGFRRLREVAEPGMWEYELAAEVEAAMQSAGADDNFGLIGAGSHNIAIRPPAKRQLEEGDLIIGEITPSYQGYLAQLCRTLVLGEPSNLQREKYDLLIRAQKAGFEAARPGQPSANIAKAVNAVIGAAGYGEYCRQPYMRTRGHGLGLGGVVPYDINEDSGPLLEENMTMVIHPNQYIPETGYMMLGDTVVIEANGPRQLTTTPTQLFWKAV